MRKRSIEELAKALAYVRPMRGGDAFAQWVLDVKAAARAAAVRNEGFSYPRFYAMCGLNEENYNA